MHRARLLVTTLIVATGLAAACGGKSPTAPTGSSDAPAATPSPAPSSANSLAGTIFSGNGAGTVTMGVPLAGVTVAIMGTSLTASADGAGHFTFTGVPAGDVDVQFTGGAVNARVRLVGVGDREQIRITVTITGSSADLTKEHRVNGSEAELEGRITGVHPGARTFEIEDVRVSVPAGTAIHHGSRTIEMSELQVGDRIHAKGSKEGDGLTARELELQHAEIEPAELSGGVTDLAGACPARTFRIGSTTIATTDTTSFLRGACGDLATGRRIEVRGIPRAGGLTATVVRFEDAEAEDTSVRGRVSNLRGACPALEFTAGNKTILTTAATQFLRGTCAQIASGVSLEVEGTANGSTVTARKVQFEDAGGAENEVEVEGALSGLSGTCPAITFTVRGKTVRTTAGTEFRDGACSTLANGTAVNAKGAAQPDGSLQATRVTTK